jgi:hypothetical protein
VLGESLEVEELVGAVEEVEADPPTEEPDSLGPLELVETPPP